MSKEYFTENISDEILAKLIDKTIRFEKNNKTNKIKISLLKIIPAVAMIALVIGLINLFTYFPQINVEPKGNDESNFNLIDMPYDDDLMQTNENYTFLIIGKDDAGLNTDTIMLITFNIKENKIAILNIPRDTYINMPNYTGKINGVLANGYTFVYKANNDADAALDAGIKHLENTIEYTFGVPINRHIMLDLDGFKYLVDAIGGVDMEVPQDMQYNDPYQNLYIDLKQGWQHLDGEKAEQLIRFRKGYINQDIGRITTQQKFIAALISKLYKFDLNTIKSLFEFGTNYMTTNISGADFAWFSVKALQVKFDDIRVHTVAGEWIESTSGYEVYKKEIIEIINKYYNPYTRDILESSFHIYNNDITNYNPGNIDIDGITLDNLIYSD